MKIRSLECPCDYCMNWGVTNDNNQCSQCWICRECENNCEENDIESRV